MKILALCAALLSSAAAAQDVSVLEAPAKTGGMIKITSAVVPICEEGERLAVYPNPKGYNIAGCWHAHGARFFVRWQDGDFSVFPSAVFKPAGGVL